MKNKLLKIFKIVVVCELLILGVVAGIRYVQPNSANAEIFKAHNSNTVESFIIKVTSIGFVKEDGTEITVWQGNEEVDLTTVTSLADVRTFNVDIPAGTYKQFGIHMSKDYKVKGSVVVDGVTYYTKTNHSNYTTGPAELEVINILGQTMDTQSFARDFIPPVQFGKGTTTSDIHILVDFSNFLTYYDGNSSTSNGGVPPQATQAGMYLWNYLPVAITFGAPAKKEVYTYTTPGMTGEGQLTIVYDSNDNPVSALARPRYINNTGFNFQLYGWLIGGTGAVTREYVGKNADGTLWIRMYDNSKQAYLGETEDNMYTIFANFQRSSHSGSFTSTGRNGNGTYTATRTE